MGAGSREDISDHVRLKRFCTFCDKEILNHTFFRDFKEKHLLKFNLQIIPVPTLSFDEHHMESFTNRLTQFLSENDLFYYKTLRQTLVRTYGTDDTFDKYYDVLCKHLGDKRTDRQIAIIKKDGRDMIGDFNLVQLIGAYLFLGKRHSEKFITAKEGSVFYDLEIFQDLKVLEYYLFPKIYGLGIAIIEFRDQIQRRKIQKETIHQRLETVP